MTQDGNERDSTKRRSLRWKGRFSRTARPLQQKKQPGEEGQEQMQLLLPPDITVKGSSSEISSFMDNSDNISIFSSSSIGSPSEVCSSGPTMTKAQLTRNKDFHDNFKQVPLNDALLHEFKCALQKDVLLQGRLYITKYYVCFKSNILGYITTVELKIEDIKDLDRVRTLRFMPRVIQVTMKNDDKYTFTSFLASLSARDEAYYSLMELWQQGHEPTAPSPVISSASSSSTTIPTTLSQPLTSPEKLPPVSILPNNNTDHNESGDTIAPMTIYTSLSNKGAASPSTISPASGHFNIFHRRRAQTVSTQNRPPNRERSATSSSTPIGKNTNGHISWVDDRQENIQPGEPRSILSSTTAAHFSSGSSILKKQKKSPTASSPTQSATHVHGTNNDRPFITINATTILTIGGFALLLSHVFLTYEFYHVTQLFTIQQQQQHYSSRTSPFMKAPHRKQQLQDTTWITGQLQDVKSQAQLWEQETLRQRQRLLDLIPS
ncbi:hypothetical protein BCR42DRAFT_421879 [Absidia repens]|uniref:GRAM domain-containing protein n=1 Tax=Absidia repens TaxID=90262 RepID=A0A1X2I6Y3_9FUNG|nr:hypothetical protein BCR42DRAFT_421879 [Absidia repens]